MIKGRQPGSTVMILGGIQGDEPGGFLSADLYADLRLKRGNLIVVPRANFRSIIQCQRGPAGDMNRKFETNVPDDPEHNVVDVIKSLMAQSDLFLNLHDGSGFYRPVWENDMANPKRYGQCIIADNSVYTHAPSGRTINLEGPALRAVERVNKDIADPQHAFHFFNMRTTEPDTPYLEQRKSATYFALTQLGIPAFAIETSKQLPSLEMKVCQHNLAVNAFLELFGVEVEHPGVTLDPPKLSYLLIAVNNGPPLAVGDGQKLLVAPGDTVEVVHVHANYERGLSVEVQGSGGLNDVHRPVRVTKATTVIARKDNSVIGQVNLGLLPEGRNQPELTGAVGIRPPRLATPATLDMLPGTKIVAAMQAKAADTRPGPPAVDAAPAATGLADGVTAFLIEVDGRPVRVERGGEVAVTAGALVKMVDLVSGGSLPKHTVMNLRGFVPKKNEARNTGEDRGATADTATDMQPDFSRDGKGGRYAINAEAGDTVLAACTLRIVQPRLASVTIRMQGKTRTLPLGSRTHIPAGAKVDLLQVVLKDGVTLSNPRFTLGGHAFPSALPQTLTMRDIALNLAVFNGEALAGKVTWDPD